MGDRGARIQRRARDDGLVAALCGGRRIPRVSSSCSRIARPCSALLIAAAGVWASHATGDARLDGLASIAIGLVLAGVAAAACARGEGADYR